MSFSNVGKVWSLDGFKEYISKMPANSWAKAVCLHHTAAPSLAQRPKGLLAQHIENIKSFYADQLGWRSGPHFFIDEDQVWGMTPINEYGVHAVSFNRNSIGIEVLGDYDSEDNASGRGLDCWRTATKATKILLDYLGLPVNEQTVLFHRDDPKTSKTCPGRKVTKQWVLDLINDKIDFSEPVKTTQLPKKEVFVPAYEILIKKGYSDAEIRASLKVKCGKVFWKDTWLEKGYYDSQKQATMIAGSELILIPLKF